jgi:hypothetical protein
VRLLSRVIGIGIETADRASSNSAAFTPRL